jgi:hypothetical protein
MYYVVNTDGLGPGTDFVGKVLRSATNIVAAIAAVRLVNDRARDLCQTPPPMEIVESDESYPEAYLIPRQAIKGRFNVEGDELS